MAFSANTESGHQLRMDAYPESGGEQSAPTPVETLLASIAGCSGMDVISILKKKRQPVTSYRIEIEGERNPPGEFPRPFKSITLRHIVEGDEVDPTAIEQAVRLSDEKYCSVIATLRLAPTVRSVWKHTAPKS